MPHGFELNTCADFQYLTVPSFTRTGKVRHGFTTRLGGISRPPLDSMNLGFGRGDNPDHVKQNYAIAGDAIGFDHNRLVAFHQVHKSDICIADESFAGCAFDENRPCFDGIITRTKNLPIATYHADCVPIFLLDPIGGAAGVVHAGWRGTALKIPAVAVEKMIDELGCDRQNILAAIGPCSQVCCYETDSDVPYAMHDAFGSSADGFLHQGESKWHVDLSALNRVSLIQCGISAENITVSSECTCCKPDIYWSHRKTGGIRGCMAAIIMLY